MGLENEVLANRNAIIEIIQNSENVNQLPLLGRDLNDNDFIPVWDSVLNKLTKVYRKDIKNGNSIISINNFLFELIKNPSNNNPSNKNILEINDMIKGWYNSTDYIEAIYLGGDKTLFNDLNVYSIIGGGSK